MATCSLSELIDQACQSGFKCLDEQSFRALFLQLLCNISQGQPASHLVYRAVLNQSGTNPPVPTILENTLGDIVWSRVGAGEYNGTLTGAFTLDKTMVLITPANASAVNEWQFFEATRMDINRVHVISTSVDISLGAAGQLDGLLSGQFGIGIEIRVYP